MDALVSGKKIIKETRFWESTFITELCLQKILKLPSINLDENKKQNKNILIKIKILKIR